ncbi:hypothetical protein TNCV_3999891 [Trichonephila clavipes]|nr:hypothetical protein TNCV_3999891 [Trichonephila clavipes]
MPQVWGSKPWTGKGRLSLSSLQWVDKGVPSLLGTWTFGFLHQIDHLTGTSAHVPQCHRSRKLRWAH